MRNVIYENNVVHKFIALYIENYVKDIIDWYKVDNLQMKYIISNEELFNKVSKIIFNVDVTKKMLDEIVNNEKIKDYDVNYDKNIIKEIFLFYNMKKVNNDYILDISNFLKDFPSLSIKYAISFYISINIHNPIIYESKKNLTKK